MPVTLQGLLSITVELGIPFATVHRVAPPLKRRLALQYRPRALRTRPRLASKTVPTLEEVTEMARTMTVSALAAVMMTGSAWATEGDPDAGEQNFRQCQACHMVGPDAANRVGPQLNGIVGRLIAGVEGYRYGPANAALGEDGSVWTEETLFEYLADPRAFVGGATRMTTRYPDEQFRWDVIAYLAQFSAEGERTE